MKNRTIEQFGDFYQKLSQNINRLSRNQNFQRLKFINFVIVIAIAIIFTSLEVSDYGANSITPQPRYQTSWIGNTFPGGEKWVQNNIEAMYVAPNGTVYTNSIWDEAAREAGIYKDGDVIGKLSDTHGWNRNGGKAVTANDQYIYIALRQGFVNRQDQDYPPEGTTWYCVRRYDLSGKSAPFSAGRGWDKSMLIVSNKSEVTGLATRGNELYVSDNAANLLRVYNTETMEEIRSFTVNNPGGIAVNKQGILWIIQQGSNPKIVNYSPEGKQLPPEITNIIEPSAIAVDSQDRVLVTENGPRQQVLIYQIKDQPVQVGTLGKPGGVYAGVPGEVEDLKFYGLTGVGTDSAGNIYVNSNGFNKSGTDLRKFSPSGKLLWQLLGLIFVDNADADPQSDGLDLFTKQEQFLMDYSKPAGKQWTYKAYTLNPFKYPQDPRLHTSPDATWVRRIQGKPFVFLTDMYESFLQIYRFNPSTDGKIAIPAGMFVGTHGGGGKSIPGNWPPQQPEKGEWIWRDRNNNGKFDQSEYDRSQDYPYIGGWWVDSKGDVWKTLRTKDGIRHYPLQGLDTHGNPIYTYSSMQKQETPSLFTDLRRIEYLPETDTMYLSGFTVDHPAVGDDTKVLGSEIVRFDNWSRGNRTPHWRIVVPHDTTGKREVSTAAMSVTRDYVFAVTFKTAEVYIYNANTGALVKKLKPGPEVAEESGWIDIPYGIRAMRRSNGEYLVFVEENAKAKVIIYRLKL
ncbi:hypothetical protein VB620_18875 [Nodularia harveyana UHCC-0300]|uniref:NHL repeat-containing protein n=1 Tax=Nodularia harveyana UHCC-0300 TaxID=2974287 RepID=A0ABU5UIQ3_9CYAN|nr:hypothetical protein [Nodularia harveyana]MEA5583397.1 hypothetical protein [Nodularia harveyana UHCC-0300]